MGSKVHVMRSETSLVVGSLLPSLSGRWGLDVHLVSSVFTLRALSSTP